MNVLHEEQTFLKSLVRGVTQISQRDRSSFSSNARVVTLPYKVSEQSGFLLSDKTNIRAQRSTIVNLNPYSSTVQKWPKYSFTILCERQNSNKYGPQIKVNLSLFNLTPGLRFPLAGIIAASNFEETVFDQEIGNFQKNGLYSALLSAFVSVSPKLDLYQPAILGLRYNIVTLRRNRSSLENEQAQVWSINPMREYTSLVKKEGCDKNTISILSIFEGLIPFTSKPQG